MHIGEQIMPAQRLPVERRALEQQIDVVVVRAGLRGMLIDNALEERLKAPFRALIIRQFEQKRGLESHPRPDQTVGEEDDRRQFIADFGIFGRNG